METLERERLRMALLSAGALYVYGFADGSGDSSDNYCVEACTTYSALGYAVERFKFTGEKTISPGYVRKYTGTPWIRVTDREGSVIKDGPNFTSYDGNGSLENEDVFAKVPFSEFIKVEDLTPPLEQQLTDMFDDIVGSEAVWDFNDAGSSGWFLWDLERNIARVAGYYNIEDTADFGNADPLGIEFDAEERA